MLSETNLARWEEEKKDRDNTNFNLQPLLYWHVISQLANPSDIERRICQCTGKLVFKLELSESIRVSQNSVALNIMMLLLRFF